MKASYNIMFYILLTLQTVPIISEHETPSSFKVSRRLNGKEECGLRGISSTRSDNDQPMHIAGLVLARCGSKGIPWKNLVEVGNMSLLQRSVSIMLKCGQFSSVWVSTDCNTIAKEAEYAGAIVHRRSYETATDEAPSIVAIKEFRDAHPEVTAVGLVQCTSPFLATPFLHDAIKRLERENLDSVFSVSRAHHLRWNVLPDGEVRALNFDPSKRPRRQDWPGELVENGMFYFAKPWLIDQGLLQGGRKKVGAARKSEV